MTTVRRFVRVTTLSLSMPSRVYSSPRTGEKRMAARSINISSWIDCAQLPASLSDLTPAQREVCLAWDDAFSRRGFAVITGHGIRSELFDDLHREMSSFFGRDFSEKEKFHHGSYGNEQGGYTPAGLESVALSALGQPEGETETKRSDPVESFVFSQRSPYLLESPSSFPFEVQSLVSVAQVYVRAHMERVVRALHFISAAALGLHDLSYIHNYYDRTVQGNEDKGNTGNSLRLAYYPCAAPQESSEPAESSLRYGAHTDYQGYTILKPDPRDWHSDALADVEGRLVSFGGLEVFDRDIQQWQKVELADNENGLVINAGDFLQRWTNDRWHSPLHRVVGQPTITTSNDRTFLVESISQDQDWSRKAIVFFSGPLREVVVKCITSQDGEQPKYEPIRARDHLLMKLSRTNHSSK